MIQSSIATKYKKPPWIPKGHFFSSPKTYQGIRSKSQTPFTQNGQQASPVPQFPSSAGKDSSPNLAGS